MWEQRMKDSIICVYIRMQVGTRVSEIVMEESLSFTERRGYAFVILVQ